MNKNHTPWTFFLFHRETWCDSSATCCFLCLCLDVTINSKLYKQMITLKICKKLLFFIFYIHVLWMYSLQKKINKNACDFSPFDKWCKRILLSITILWSTLKCILICYIAAKLVHAIYNQINDMFICCVCSAKLYADVQRQVPEYEPVSALQVCDNKLFPWGRK